MLLSHSICSSLGGQRMSVLGAHINGRHAGLLTSVHNSLLATSASSELPPSIMDHRYADGFA